MNAPGDPVGAAAHRAAQNAGAVCRHWTVSDTARTLEGMRRESDQWSQITGIPWRPLLRAMGDIHDLEQAADMDEFFAKLNREP